MPNALLIAFGAGLVSATVFVSAMAGPLVLRMLLFLVTPLALFLAGLAAGPRAAAIAGLVGTVLVGVASNATSGLVFATSQAAPVFLLCYLASLNRETPDGTEWYPVGRIVIAAALLAGLFSALTLLLLGADLETLRSTVRELLQNFVDSEFSKVPDAPQLSPEEIDEAAGVALALMPAVSGMSTMASILFNMWLAGRITLASGYLQRPWPDIAAMTYPSAAPLMLAAATGAAFLAGLAGLIASGFAGPLFLAYVLMGLAIIHFASRGWAWRPFALAVLYGGLVFLNTLASLALAFLGLIETIAPIRKPKTPPNQPPTS